MSEDKKKFLEDNKIAIIILAVIILLLLLAVFYFYIFKQSASNNISDVKNSNTVADNNYSISISDYLALNPDARSRPISELDKNGDGIIDYRDGISLNNDLNSSSSSSSLNTDNNFNNFATDSYQFDYLKYNREGYFNLSIESEKAFNNFASSSDLNSNYSSVNDNFNNNYNPDNYSVYTNTTGLGGETNFDNYLNDLNNLYKPNTNDPTEVVNNQSPINLTKLSSTQGIFWNTNGQSNPDKNSTSLNSLYFFYYASSSIFWFCIDKGDAGSICNNTTSSSWIKVINDGSLYSYGGGAMNTKYNLLGNWFFTLNYNKDIYGLKSNSSTTLSTTRIYFKDKESNTNNPNYLVIVY